VIQKIITSNPDEKTIKVLKQKLSIIAPNSEMNHLLNKILNLNLDAPEMNKIKKKLSVNVHDSELSLINKILSLEANDPGVIEVKKELANVPEPPDFKVQDFDIVKLRKRLYISDENTKFGKKLSLSPDTVKYPHRKIMDGEDIAFKRFNKSIAGEDMAFRFNTQFVNNAENDGINVDITQADYLKKEEIAKKLKGRFTRISLKAIPDSELEKIRQMEDKMDSNEIERKLNEIRVINKTKLLIKNWPFEIESYVKC